MAYEVKFNQETYKEEVVSGTEKEIKRYNFYMKLWRNRSRAIWVILLIQIIPILTLFLFDNVSLWAKIYLLFPAAVVAWANIVLWFSVYFELPYTHPVLNFIKRQLFIKGKYMQLFEIDRKSGCYCPDFGFYLYYDEKTKNYIFDAYGDIRGFKFFEIIP